MDLIGQRISGLMSVGIIVSVYGLYLWWRAITGDTRLRGSEWTYFPRSYFFAAGLILQLPLVAIIWFLGRQGAL